MISTNFFLINFLICLIIFVINFKYRFIISKKLKIIDIPDNERKLHKKSTPLNGSLWFALFLLILLIQSLFFENFINLQFRLIYLSVLIIFIVGYIDDRKSINPNLRLLLYFIIFYILISFEKSFQLKIVYFESLGLELNTSIYASLFSAFCLTAFINSINLIDGINSLANSIITIILLIIFIKFNNRNFIIFSYYKQFRDF